MSKQTSSPYGPNYYELKEQQRQEKAIKEEANLRLKEIATDLKSLLATVATITK